MVVDSKTYEAHIQAFKDKGFRTWERGGDYHSGLEVDTCIFHDDKALTIACCEPKMTSNATLHIWHTELLESL